MNHTIEFESDHFVKNGHCTINQIEIELIAKGSCVDDIECDYVIESIYNVDLEKEMTLEDFPKEEHIKILNLCEEACQEYGYEAWEQR